MSMAAMWRNPAATWVLASDMRMGLRRGKWLLEPCLGRQHRVQRMERWSINPGVRENQSWNRDFLGGRHSHVGWWLTIYTAGEAVHRKGYPNIAGGVGIHAHVLKSRPVISGEVNGAHILWPRIQSPGMQLRDHCFEYWETHFYLLSCGETTKLPSLVEFIKLRLILQMDAIDQGKWIIDVCQQWGLHTPQGKGKSPHFTNCS